MSEYEIEKNIPPPKFKYKGDIKGIISQMQPGDSILLDNLYQAQSLYQAIKKTGKLSIRRKEGNKYRVWLLNPSVRETPGEG